MQEEYNPDIVSVVDEDGKEHIFEELDRIETDSGKYVALVPLYDEAEQMLEDDGELIVLKVQEEKGEIFLTQIEDENEFSEITALFEKRLSELYDFEDEDTAGAEYTEEEEEEEEV
jgi:uncharacterized protein YrzB (UPF0473 family)